MNPDLPTALLDALMYCASPEAITLHHYRRFLNEKRPNIHAWTLGLY